MDKDAIDVALKRTFKWCICLWLVLLMSNDKLTAQDSNRFNDYGRSLVSPSPQSYSFIKFGDIPVSNYTGVPNISIPIMEINQDGLSIPISLSYHSSGIKVGEEASTVGLGWSLNAGGAITQSVIGGEDYSMGFIGTDMPDVPPPGTTIYSSSTDTSLEPIYSLPQTMVIVNRNCDLRKDNTPMELLSQMGESQPDVFSYNFPGYSGKFVIDHIDGGFLLKNQDLINIKKTNSSNNWEIKDENGHSFQFNDTEIIYSGPGVAESKTYFLSKIKTNAGNIIEFVYFKPTGIVSNVHSLRENFSYGVGSGFDFPNYTHDFTTSYYSPILLKEIRFPEGRIVFDYSSRLDIHNGFKLFNIKVFDDSNKEIKRIDLMHDYFQSTSQSGYLQPGIARSGLNNGNFTNDELLKRLKLTSVKFSTEDNPYVFEYREDQALPSKSSYGRDFWGFYNGKINNTKLIPDPYKYYDNFDISEVPPLSYRADRRSDSVMLNWMISKVVYPTKGYAKFLFEPNTFSNYDIHSQTGTVVKDETASVFMSDGYHNDSNKESTFSLQASQNVQFVLKYGLNASQNPNQDQIVKLRIYKGTSMVKEWSMPTDATCTNSFNEVLNLTAGTYKLQVFVPSLNIINYTCSSSTASITARYNETASTELEMLSSGAGARVRKISFYEKNNSLLNEKEFIYEFDTVVNNETKSYSYGKIMSLPRFYKKTLIYKANEINGSAVEVGRVERMDYSGDSYIGLNDLDNGNLIGYSKVIIRETGNGSKELDYFNEENNCNPDSPTPCLSNMRNGQLLMESDHNESDVLLSREIFSYEEPNLSRKQITYGLLRKLVAVYNGSHYDPPHGTPFDVDCYRYELHFYPIIGYKSNLLSVNAEKYFNNTRTQFQTDLIYYNNHLLKEEVINGNNGSVIKKTYEYPAQFTSAIYNQMNSDTAHQKGRIVKFSIYENDNLTYSRLNNFTRVNNRISIGSLSENFNGGYLPNNIDIKYDSRGRITEHKKNGIYYSYRYELARDSKIAQTENASFAQISQTSFETTEKGGWTYSGTPLTFTGSRTGRKEYNLGTGTVSKSGTGATSGSKFKLTFWARRPAGPGNWTFMGQSEALTANWKLIERIVETGSVTISGSGIHIDELRLHPVSALMTTYTYDPLVGMTSKTDPRNYTHYYEYDAYSRLKTVKDEDGHILEHFEYNYAGGN